MSMRTHISILLAVSLFFFAGCTKKSAEGGNYSEVAADDAAMNGAIQKAKATSSEFIEAFRAQKPGTTGFYVKKPFRTPTNGHEHMWIEVLSESDGVLQGIIANEAEDTKEVRMGQKVSLKLSEISDWKYQEGKKMIGGYTIRYFIDKLSPKDQEAFLKESGFEL